MSARWDDLMLLALLAFEGGCSAPEDDTISDIFDGDTLSRHGLAMTPPMGWSSWNAFGCDIDEGIIRAQADALVASGMRDLGYLYVNVDDCWMAGGRSPDGTLGADPDRFPSGMRALADYVHARGLRLGLYSSPGEDTCDGLPASGGFEEIDARQYAAWGVDYLKYDRCGLPDAEAIDSFVRMRLALEGTGRPIVFSINPDGATWNRPWSEVAHLWRTTPDIEPTWDAFEAIIDENEPLARSAGPGGWNDPDMLEVGVGGPDGLSAGEARLEISLWAIMAAPLISGADLTRISADAFDIYRNAEVIAVDQDPLGAQGWRVRDEGDAEVWMKPLAEPGARAVALVNRGSHGRLVTAQWSEVLLEDGTATVRDMWRHVDLGERREGYSVEVPGHDVVLLRVLGTRLADAYEAESLDNTLAGDARVAACRACSGTAKVGWVGNGRGVLAINGLRSQSDRAGRLSISYASGEVRWAMVRVNGDRPVWVRFPSTGGFDWPAETSLTIHLSAGDNTIELSNPEGWAPDFDRIRVE